MIASAASERESLILGFVGIALALLVYFVAPSQTAPLWIVGGTAIAAGVVVWILIAAVKKTVQGASLPLPTVLTVVPDESDAARPILLLEPSDLFGSSTLVSVYHRDTDTEFEVLVAHGTVRTVQSNRKVQVKIDEWIEGNNAIVDCIANCRADTLNKLIVRPSVVRQRSAELSPETMFRIVSANLLERYSQDPDMEEGQDGQSG
jgi:hypothetical protein